MRTAPRALTFFVLVVGAALPAAAGPDRAGVRWEGDVAAALDRAAREGRPVLLAVNALETESANQRLALDLYPSRAWGDATRDYVCLVGNPNLHPGPNGCARYGSIPCRAHQDALRLAYRLRALPFDATIVSPAHHLLDSDGRLVWWKEYYTGVVSPAFLERKFVALSPSLALDRAVRTRLERMNALEAEKTTELEEKARAWIGEGDPLAPAAILDLADGSLDEARRLALVRALGATPADLASVVDLAAYEVSLAPDETDPALTEAWLETARSVLGPAAAAHVARAVLHTTNERLRRRILTQWLGAAGAGPGAARAAERLPPAERPAALEALVLLGRGPSRIDLDSFEAPWRHRLARARARAAGKDHGGFPALGADLDRLGPGDLRGALLRASPDLVRRHAAGVRTALRERPEERVRIAAALALLGAGLDEGGLVPSTIVGGAFDPLEGEATRREAVRRLGRDPGGTEEAWLEALRAAVGGGR